MFKTILKFIFAIALLTWLIKSGRLEFDPLVKSLDYPFRWIIALVILSSNIALTSFRWKLLLETKSKTKFPPLKILKLQWIGNLFNTALPGAVSGDLIKLVYAKNLDNQLTKTFLLTSALLDRIIGLIGLIFMLGLSGVLQYDFIQKMSGQVIKIVQFNYILFFFSIIFLIFLLLREKQQKRILSFINIFPYIGKLAGKTISQFWIVGKNRKLIFSLILLSMCTQGANLFAFWYLAEPFFQYKTQTIAFLTFFQFLCILPIGLIVIAIPITPSGLGLGHAIYDHLFSQFGIINGASLFNIFFCALVFINLLGIIPYLMNNTVSSPKKLKQFDQTS